MSTATLPKVGEKPKRVRLHHRLMQQEASLGYALLIPTALMLLVFLAWPFFWGIWLSMSSAEIGDPGHFVGFGNFVYNLGDTIFVQSFWNTMAYTAITTVFKFGLGMTMALLLNQVFPLQRFARAALLLPWIIPSVLSTLAWRWMFDPTFSVLNWVLMHSFHAGGVNWLGTTNTALASIFIVNIWRGAPFYGISLLAGLQTIPPDLYEAARVDGASRWQQFREITLPLLRPVLLVVLMLSTILTFADFQLPYVLTRGAPYNSTNVLATWAFNIGVPGGSIGIGAAISLVLFPLLAVAITGVLVSLRSKE
jgi:multiple sugar transport system permease protein